MKNLLMKLGYFNVFAALLCGIVFCSCNGRVITGSGVQQTLTLNLSNFTKIEADNALQINVTINPSAPISATLAGDEAQFKYIATSVKDGKLHITCKENCVFMVKGGNPVLTVTMPSLEALDLSGDNDADIKGTVKGSNLITELSGHSNVTFERIDVTEMSQKISGAGTVNIGAGNVKKATYSISGAASVNAYGLTSNDAKIEISGTGTANVTAVDKLDVEISGAATVKYKGTAKVLEDISGVGSVTHVN